MQREAGKDGNENVLGSGGTDPATLDTVTGQLQRLGPRNSRGKVSRLALSSGNFCGPQRLYEYLGKRWKLSPS
jgi:hypothetical protein